MLSSRRICPFGLPDEAEGIENVVLAAVGHTFRAATAPLLDTPLPAELAGLLRRIDRQERNAQARGRAALPRRRRVKLGDRPSPAPHISNRPTAGPAPALTAT